ncbi:hypothetical protein SynRS9909_00369 [Synechococcus sp. RS9909]|nr:hypothetical protein SynRS9909_00369 [Synechococcus sp. RS9909]
MSRSDHPQDLQHQERRAAHERDRHAPLLRVANVCLVRSQDLRPCLSGIFPLSLSLFDD